MEDTGPTYQYEQSSSISGFHGADQGGNQRSALGLPSFEGFYRSVFADTYHQKTMEPYPIGDQSSDTSEPSFSIDNIMRGDNSSFPRSSTPDVLCDTQTDQSETSDPSLTIVKQKATSVVRESAPSFPTEAVSVEPVRRPHKRHEDKPPYTYVAMVIIAIELSEEKALTIAEIRASLQRMFPFFSGPYTGWKESVRHCLSRGKHFYQGGSTEANAGQRRWMVNRSLLKPGLFNRTKHGPEAKVYRETLHEQLGVLPVSIEDHDARETIDSCSRDLLLPPQHCYTITTETAASDDFLRARKESFPDNDDARSELMSPRASSVVSDLSVDSLLGKRKRDSVSELPTKRPRHAQQPSSTTTTGATPGQESAYAQHNLGYNTYDYGLHQMPQYQHPYYSMSGYQMPAFYSHLPFYRQPHAPDHSGSWQGSGYSDATSGYQYRPYWPTSDSPGLQAAMTMWYHRQIRPSETDFQYDYRWYAQPEVSAEAGVDLTVSAEKE